MPKKVLASIYVDNVDDKVVAIEESLKGDHKPSMADIKGPRLGPADRLGRHHPGRAAAVRGHQRGVLLLQLDLGCRRIRREQGVPDSTIISAVNVIFTFVAIALIDRVGRKFFCWSVLRACS